MLNLKTALLLREKGKSDSPKKTRESHHKNTPPKKITTKWVVKNKCLVIHTALKAGNTPRWYLDSGCSRHMTGDRS